MKTIVAIGLMALFLVLVVIQWMEYHPASAPASASQIFIHGTPVCVFRHGDSIVARVGECGGGSGLQDEATGDDIPEEGAPGSGLPPGHPPVGPDMSPDGRGRRVLI